MWIVIVIAAIVVYGIIGFFIDESSLFDKPKNPVQDSIRWMDLPYIVVILLWLPSLVVWYLSSLLAVDSWQNYISHEDRMNVILDERLREIDREFPNAGDVSYGIPSPRAYRERGSSAFNITVEMS